MKRKLTMLASFLFLSLIPVFCLAKDATNYVPMEEIPGFGKPEDFPSYLMAIYEFGLWAIGISAVFMIMIGGYMYMTSAGNNAQTGKAKGVITDAIAGLILALVSYVLLYTINPELVQFKPLQNTLPNTTSSSSSNSGGNTGGNSGGGSVGKKSANFTQACPTGEAVVENEAIVAIFNGAPADSKIVVDPKCAVLIPNDVEGVDAKILRTIAQIESSCGTDTKESDGHACGAMQLKPKTASELAERNVTCEELIANRGLSISLAAKYIAKYRNSSCVNNNLDKIFAGYNGGYGCTQLTDDGKKPALYPSHDCPSFSAFECCENPGELKETISYVWNARGLMAKQ